MTRLRLLLPLCLLPATASGAAERVDFEREIRPLLTHHCTACHGGVKAAGGISYLSLEQALAEGESGRPALVPGKPEASEMLRRIRSTDPDEVMPKPKHGPPLSAAEAQLIERWIAQGAEWKNHWAFEKPVEPPTPAVSDGTWPLVPLDRFILRRLERENLAPSAAAPPAEWLRRASFDLTGLPPTPGELTAFLTESTENPQAARARAADRLLASPGFGERWAAVWMDLARYSDTYGFEKDPHRNIWPYRDWLIRAFNEDMPYDRFTIEQLAGDLLPEATVDQRLATAFHRNTQCNTEGGTDDEEFRVAAVLDRVSTTWTAWQATTFGCVQCHDHPYEPIRHEEFYQFAAFFNNTLDSDQDDDFPRMKVADDPALGEEASRLETTMRSLRDSLNDDGRPLAETADGWQPFVPDVLKPSHGKLSTTAEGIIQSEGTLPTGSSHDVEGPAHAFTALRLEILPDADDPKKWPERGALATHFEVRQIAPDGSATPLAMKEVFVDRIDGPHEPHPGGNVGGFPKLEGPRWAVFVPVSPVEPAPGSRIGVLIKQGQQTAGQQATPVRRFAISLANHSGWTDLAGDPQRLAKWAEWEKSKKRHKEIPGTLVPVMIERTAPAPRETRIFARGNRLSKEDAVSPGLPALFRNGNSAAATSRLDMARWLVGPDNPLAARVLANRLWAELFGAGIVASLEDFGTSGEAPSHPDLLDHLALRLREHHQWSVKRMLRELVLSATYGQSHKATAELVEKDPGNRLLARGPRVRLSAEMVRDQALAAAGLLSAKMHGPSVFPPQPEGIWSSAHSGAKWKESVGEDRFRRGVYTYNKRTSGFPGFLTFDAPSRDLCSARRINSNTPLQALVTLNDPAHIEAAQGLANRMAAHSPDIGGRIAFGVLLVTQKPAASATLDDLISLHRDAAADYTREPELAAMIGPDPESAALVLVANTILNLDTALNR